MANGDGPLSFTYVSPNISGGLAVGKIPQRTERKLVYNVKLAKIADGTPRQVAERIGALAEVGADLVQTAFLHLQQAVASFGERLLRLVHRLEATRYCAKAA
jgi:alkanesulfonate monooxygenase SsuD/methylene tetrahydromethanopterin reductase-like flavin-dependent oxidoreductase (luciferase family)